MKPKVLVADDSASIQKIILMAFEKESVEIQGIGDGQAAFELLDSFQPDLVLADTKMPGFDGFELSRRIKESNPAIAVILLESDFEDFDEARFKKSRADDHIAKPFKSDDIIQKVKALLREPGGPQPLEEIIQDIEMLDEADRESSLAEGNSQRESTEELNEVFAAIAGAPHVEIRDLESSATPLSVKPDSIEETLSNLPALSGNLQPEEDAPADPAPETAAVPPQISSDALNQVIGEHVSRAVEKSLDEILRQEISGLSDSVMETIRGMVKEMAPEIIRSVVQKEIDNIKKAEDE